MRFHLRFLLLASCVMALFVSCEQGSGKRQAPIMRDSTHYTEEEYINLAIDSNQLNTFLQKNAAYAPYTDFIKDFYTKRDFHYAWISATGPTEQASSFINMIRTDAHFGIGDSSLMNKELGALFDTLNNRVNDKEWKPNDSLVSKTEMLMTAQFFAYGDKVWGGMTADSAKDLEWFIPRKKMDMASLLDSLIANPNQDLSGNEPVNKQYRLLRKELSRINKIAEEIPHDSLFLDKKTYKKGDSAAVIAKVKERLHAWGDLPNLDSSAIFDAGLDSAIRHYQGRMGLTVNGQLQQATINSLNVPVAKLVEKILINMERLRWVPVDVKGEYILVNIPEFKLHVFDHDSLAWSCNVVVGTPGASTVIFSREMKYVVFAPYWNVPPGILSREILPAVKRNPSYLARHNMEVVGASGKVIPTSSISWSKYTGRNFPYIIRQKPGRSNSLGKVKFLFPNEYNIYLHDTPSKHLFQETKRSFSHGCIRVSEPRRLAEYLLRHDSTWTDKKIDEAMNAKKEKYVVLKDKVPVFIGYFTAWVNHNGVLNFRNDVYGHDAQLAKQLFSKE
ncbi:murein L,D-transpeptidase [Chitinophaga caeni]|uniref:Murein L,D-transpeptidase n=1 Tax=Chitinophaga caeni TaxID=2029983 RepID=A0A291QSC1_9BACT|nr:L,D-transpeptidase family protein [Chitinophaga caeni]ATL46811.1 murein L,D-transpeptidase [Chitinophaga caeni]